MAQPARYMDPVMVLRKGDILQRLHDLLVPGLAFEAGVRSIRKVSRVEVRLSIFLFRPARIMIPNGFLTSPQARKPAPLCPDSGLLTTYCQMQMP